MPLISDDTILEVQRSVDIYEVVSGYIPLRRSGANYKGLCPFHEEKTPSFMVHPERQFYKCFGCGKGGNGIGFVMALEKIDFPEAVKLLAERAGIIVRYKDGQSEGPDRTDVYKVLDWTAKHYRRLLTANPEAAKARQYAQQRGLTAETLETWDIGYSLDSWDDLVTSARKNGFRDQTLQAAGLLNERKSGGFYDRFRGRFMFPIRDVRGRVVGFGGRILGDGEPKYLNSPDSIIFSKGRLLYGLDVAKERIQETKTLYIVEGYFDVVLPAQHGVDGMIATLGTALTRDHLSLLRRYAERIVLVFDSDAAGKRAAERGLELLLAENLDLFVARVPAGKDPADVVTQQGPDPLRDAIENPIEIFEFLVECLESRLGGNTPATRTRIVEEMAERIAQVPNEIKRELLIQKLASRYALPERAIRDAVYQRQEKIAPKPLATAEVMPHDETIGRELIEVMLADSESFRQVMERIPPKQFPTPETQKIAAKLVELFEKDENASPTDLVALMQDEESMGLVADILSRDTMTPDALEKKREGCFEYLDTHDFKRRAQGYKALIRAGQDADEQARALQKSRKMRNPRAVPRSS